MIKKNRLQINLISEFTEHVDNVHIFPEERFQQYDDVSSDPPVLTSSSDNMSDNNFDNSRDTENLSLTNSSDIPKENEDEPSFLSISDSRDELLRGNINTKIITWALRNITSLTHKCIDELLLILRNEGHLSLPKSSKTLLKTNKAETNIRQILCNSGKYGLFNYFNIKVTLKKIISPDIYTEEEILLTINIDGASIHQSSKKTYLDHIRSAISSTIRR
jgi:hypothetical protein